jgi:hypothetical protein
MKQNRKIYIMNDTKEKHATHTPGPWELVQERDYLNIQETKTNLIVAHICSVSEADARLIAAAPEMFEMCKLLLPIMQDIADDGHIRRGESRKGEHADKLREVLAKVEGGEG